MQILARCIGILITAMGIVFLLKPETMKQLVIFFRRGKRLYLAGCLRLLFGVILLLAASQCRWVGVVVALGILMLIGGISIFVIGLEKLKSLLQWWQGRPSLVLRLIGLIALALGVLLVYSA